MREQASGRGKLFWPLAIPALGSVPMNTKNRHTDQLRRFLSTGIGYVLLLGFAISQWWNKVTPEKARLRVMRFVGTRFPKMFEEETEPNIPRGTYNPPRYAEIVTGSRLEKRTAEEAIEYCTTMGFIKKTYRLGTYQYQRQLVGGRELILPALAMPPENVDPSDERWGFFCYQLTNKGNAYINQRGQSLRWFIFEHYKMAWAIVGAIVTAAFAAYWKLK